MKILKVTDPAFTKYGRVIGNVDFTGLVEALKKTPCPEDVVYEPSVEALEALPVMEELSRIVYGEMPIQIGYCNGHNVMLNALEYHRDSEINVAATDAVLMRKRTIPMILPKWRLSCYRRERLWRFMPPHCTMRPVM